jgi:hypothetical protein
LADGPNSSTQESASGCQSEVDIDFPSVTLHPENGPRYARVEATVLSNCTVSMSQPVLLMNAPAVTAAEQPGKFQGPATEEPGQFSESAQALGTTRTVEINIWEEDCCGIRTNGMRTAQTYSYTGSTVTLLSLSSPWDACCYWWHLLSGPKKSNGYTSSSEAWAKGVVRFYCNWSDPLPFCPGFVQQYPIKHIARMTLYGNGYIKTTGTKSKGIIIPLGKVVYTARVY